MTLKSIVQQQQHQGSGRSVGRCTTVLPVLLQGKAGFTTDPLFCTMVHNGGYDMLTGPVPCTNLISSAALKHFVKLFQ